jgi:phospholipid transport system substrate-binding protein
MTRPTSLALILGAAFLTLPPVTAVGAADETKPVKAEAKPAKAETKTKTKADAKPAKTEAKADTKADAKPDAKAAKVAAVEKPSDKPTEKSPPPPANSSPMAELKRSNEKLDKILTKNRPNWSPEAELQREEVRKLVGSFLDYNELSRRSLARHWDTISSKQREEFVSTLRDLVERSYLKQVHGNANYNIKYDKEIKDGNDATVTGVLNTTARGKKVKIALEYKMLWRGDHWVVYDVVTDEQSMVENYRAEFNKIINKDGFETLLKRMKRKLDEKEE